MPCLPHIFPEHIVPQAVKEARLDLRVSRSQAGFFQGAHEPIRVFAVVLTELSRSAVRFPTCDAVCAIELFFNGVMVELQVPNHGQDVAAQAAEALAQEEEAVSHAGQLQLLLSLRATDAAIEEREVRGRVGHDGGDEGSKTRSEAVENDV